MSTKQKNLLTTIVLGIGLTISGLLVVYAKRGHCFMCPTFQCVSSGQCGGRCVCVKGPGEMFGSCMSFGSKEMTDFLLNSR